jgi:hypothetical protein
MIGIYAPYLRKQSTWMALSLAQYINDSGRTVSVFAEGESIQGVSNQWDSRVIRDKPLEFKQWLYKCQHVIWFGMPHKRIQAASRFGCRNTLVALYDQLTAQYGAELGNFSEIVCPSVYMRNHLQKLWVKDIIPAPWDTGSPLVSKPTLIDKEKIKLFVPIENGAVRAYSPRVMYSLSLLLSSNPGLSVTVCASKRLPYAGHKALQDLRAGFPDRVKLFSGPSQEEFRVAFRQHDWTFYPYRHDDVGWIALESLCAGTPVITFDSDVMREVVDVDAGMGYLIDGSMVNDRFGLPTMVDPSPLELVQGLSASVMDLSLLAKCNSVQWSALEKRRRGFRAQWASILDRSTV